MDVNWPYVCCGERGEHAENCKSKPVNCNGCKTQVGNYGGCVTAGCEGTAYWGKSSDPFQTDAAKRRRVS
ncbi:MAG: hypothetical protein K2X77_18440 [Candidatus Obscuribacterales bacterium]|nr:hypothetical protein [Candidatus Obscuribacterales bacterium]